jgi:hypothetical protein
LCRHASGYVGVIFIIFLACIQLPCLSSYMPYHTHRFVD